MSKAQGLPLNTVVIIVMVILVLAGLALFFFTSFQKGEGEAERMNCDQKCEEIRAFAESSGWNWHKLANRDFSEKREYCENCVNHSCCFTLSTYRGKSCVGYGQTIDCELYGSP